MAEEHKTIEQLTNELTEMRRRIAELEALRAERQKVQDALPQSQGNPKALAEKANEELQRETGGRKQAEEAVLDSMSEFVLYHDKEMEVLWANRVTGELLGLTPEQLTGRHCYEMWHQRDEPCVGCPVKEALESGEPQKAEVNAPDGRVLLVRGYPLCGVKGDVVGVVEVALDITGRKRAEEALAAEKERLAVTLRSIGDGVITTNNEAKIVSISKVAEALTGWTEEEAVGKPLEGVFRIINEDTRGRCESPVEKVLQSGRTIDLADNLASDAVLIARDGTERIIADSAAPIRDKGTEIIGAVIVFRDITEERKMEEELLKTQKLESIGVLAGGIAHDFNNILTGILGNISLARMYTDPDKVSEKLAEAERASFRARDLTQQLLTFSRGGTPIRRIASIAESLRDSTIFALRGSNVRCEFSIPDELLPVEVDEGQMNQVIGNLVINADQAMPQGGILKVRAENVTVGAEDALPLRDGGYVKISIEDRGIGIPKEHLQRIFDPYFTTKQKGSGLGLATCYSIIKNHDGYITAESQVGMGATFHIYLPASSGATLVRKQEEEKPVVGAGKILVMDDEKIIRKLASDMLASIGYEVATAADGAEAIELYREAKELGDPFDVVIIDLTVPGSMGGKEAVQRLIEIDPGVKAIVSSGYSNDPIMADFRKYGFKDVIVKPYKTRELSEILARSIELSP